MMARNQPEKDFALILLLWILILENKSPFGFFFQKMILLYIHYYIVFCCDFMKNALKKGLGFGLTSGVITTLGLMVGLNASTQSSLVVLGGIITIAVADAFSDAFGVHISEEFDKKNSDEHVWASTFSTFFFKFIFAITFAIPVLFLELQTALVVSIIWGAFLLSAISFKMAREQKESVLHVVAEHLVIFTVVLFATNFIGNWISVTFI